MTLVQYPISETIVLAKTGLTAHVGNTPLLPLSRISQSLNLPPTVSIYAKAEWFNPGGSVKDRPALNIIRAAIANHGFRSGMRLLDSTSGNMGISYATLGAALGIPVTLTLPENVSSERISIIRALGAELILTDPLEGSDGAILVAHEIATKNPERYFYANQYDNPANWYAHFKSTGPEIWSQTHGQVTHLVVGTGTSGTMTGAGSYLRETNSLVKIVAIQPDAAFHGLEGLKHMESAIKPGIYNPNFADRSVKVSTEDAHLMVLRLAREEGLFVGISSGAAAVAALQVASDLQAGMVVTVFPDAGYKYLSEKSIWQGEKNVGSR